MDLFDQISNVWLARVSLIGLTFMVIRQRSADGNPLAVHESTKLLTSICYIIFVSTSKRAAVISGCLPALRIAWKFVRCESRCERAFGALSWTFYDYLLMYRVASMNIWCSFDYKKLETHRKAAWYPSPRKTDIRNKAILPGPCIRCNSSNCILWQTSEVGSASSRSHLFNNTARGKF